MCRTRLNLVAVSCIAAISSTAVGQIDVPSDGSDGIFLPTGNIQVDLSLAASLCDCDNGGVLDDECRWDCPSPVGGQGVYDAEQWAVVFKYANKVLAEARVVIVAVTSGIERDLAGCFSNSFTL